MKKFNRKSKVIIICAAVGILLITALVSVRIYQSKKCQDIIGDGYYMGTDPEPVIIGNTCDL